MVDWSGSLDSAEKKLPTRISSFKCGKHFSDYPETRFEDNPSMTTCGHKPHGHATRRKKGQLCLQSPRVDTQCTAECICHAEAPCSTFWLPFRRPEVVEERKKKKNREWRRSGGKQPAEREPPTGRSRCGLRCRPPVEGLAVFSRANSRGFHDLADKIADPRRSEESRRPSIKNKPFRSEEHPRLSSTWMAPHARVETQALL